ncbi:MAG TPA: glycosyltransferase [Gammaproteobacteria bacterium]|nr:glycosyltransferase [Gammaproteobacteria bacterium]
MAATLLSVNNYYYARGGAEVAFFRHNSMLRAAGWSIVPFSMNHERNEGGANATFVDEIELGGNDGALTKARKALKAVYSFEARRKIAQLIERVTPNICHAHNVYHHISPSILSLVRRRGIPLVMTLHDLKIACPAYSMLTHDGVCERCRDGRLFQVVTHRCMKGSVVLSTLIMIESYLHRYLGSYVANVDRFLVPSRFYLRKLVEWGFDPERFVYVPNFIDTAAVEPRFTPGTRFVYFGRLSPEKGLATLLYAAARARVGVDLVGTGPQAAELEALAKSAGTDVRFLGFLSGTALAAAIGAARAVVVPSEWYENAPLSALEAAALGKALIVANIGGLPELVANGETGWTFEPRAVDALAERLSHVAAMPNSALEALGRAARARVEAEFSPRRYRDDIRRVYTGLGVVWP